MITCLRKLGSKIGTFPRKHEKISRRLLERSEVWQKLG